MKLIYFLLLSFYTAQVFSCSGSYSNSANPMTRDTQTHSNNGFSPVATTQSVFTLHMISSSLGFGQSTQDRYIFSCDGQPMLYNGETIGFTPRELQSDEFQLMGSCNLTTKAVDPVMFPNILRAVEAVRQNDLRQIARSVRNQ